LLCENVLVFIQVCGQKKGKQNISSTTPNVLKIKIKLTMLRC